MADRAETSLAGRRRGSLWGLAVGNAFGSPVEGQMPGTFDPVTEYRGGGSYGLLPGQWTGDVSLALALADSMAETGWDLSDQVRRYIAWWRGGAYTVNGCAFGIQIETEMALQRLPGTWRPTDVGQHCGGVQQQRVPRAARAGGDPLCGRLSAPPGRTHFAANRV